MKKKSLLLVLMLVLLMVPFVGCSPKDEVESDSSKTGEMVDVTIYGVVDPQVSGQQIIAKENGYFEKYGVNVTNNLLEGSSDMSSLIAGGTAQASFESTYTDIALAANGVGIKMLCPVADIGGTQAIVARKGLDIKSAKDLEGLKIGMPSGAGVLAAIKAMSEELDVDFDSFEFVTLDPSDQIAAMENGNIDLMAGWEPWVGTAVKNGGTLLFSGTHSYLPGAEGDVDWLNFHTTFQVTEQFYNDHYDATVAMMKALVEATDFINNNREEAAKIIAEEINVDYDQVLDIMSKNTYSVEFNDAFRDATNKMSKFMLEQGNIDKVPEFDTFGEPAPLAEADPSQVSLK